MKTRCYEARCDSLFRKMPLLRNWLLEDVRLEVFQLMADGLEELQHSVAL
jgi:hypothetical protein